MTMTKWMMDGNFLESWTDTDIAMHSLALRLEIIPNTPNSFIEYKYIYWSDNPIGNFLFSTLQHLVSIKFLLYNDENQKFKRNTEFPNLENAS